MTDGPVPAPMPTGQLNASIFANWHPETINPAQSLAQGMAAGNAILQNRRLRAQLAAGQDYQASINPLTGRPDLADFGQRLRADGNAAFAAQDAYQEALHNATTAYNLHMGKMQALSDAAGAVLAIAQKNPEQAYPALKDSIVNLVKNGVISAGQGAQAIGEAPTDPKQLTPWLQTFSNQLNNAKTAAENIIGAPTTLHVGNALVPGSQSAYGGAFTPQGKALPLHMTPGEAATPVTVPGAGGVMVEPKGTYGAQAHANALVSATPPMSSLQETVAPDALGTGRPASAPRSAEPIGPGEISYPKWAKVTPGASSFIPAGLPELQKQSEALFTQDQNEVAALAQKSNLLQSIVAEGSNANPGALSGYFEDLGSSARQLGLATGEEATDLNLVQKDVSQLVQQQASKLGIPTDQKLAEVTFGTPNGKMTPQAIRGASAQLLGMYNYKAAELNAFDKWSQSAPHGYEVGPAAYAAFNRQFQAKVPVAVFQWGALSPSLRSQYWKSLGKGAQKQLQDGMNYAVQNGLITKAALQGD